MIWADYRYSSTKREPLGPSWTFDRLVIVSRTTQIKINIVFIIETPLYLYICCIQIFCPKEGCLAVVMHVCRNFMNSAFHMNSWSCREQHKLKLENTHSPEGSGRNTQNTIQKRFSISMWDDVFRILSISNDIVEHAFCITRLEGWNYNTRSFTENLSLRCEKPQLAHKTFLRMDQSIMNLWMDQFEEIVRAFCSNCKMQLTSLPALTGKYLP